MIVPAEYRVEPGAFEWVGLLVEEFANEVVVSRGRIGRTRRPLTWQDGVVDGGWHVDRTVLVLSPLDRTVDLVLDLETEETVYIIRSDDENEQYDGDRYEHFLTLLYRESNDEPWHMAVPSYG